MFSRVKKYILSSFTMLGFASIVALGLMFVAYLIPIDLVRGNVKNSAIQIASDGFFRQTIKGVTGAGIENFSVCFSLGQIVFDGDYSIKDKVLLNPNYETELPKYYDVMNVANKVKGGVAVNYARYWHGIVFFLKLAHIWFDIVDIRIINLVLQNLLLLGVLYLICKKLNIFYALSYLLAVIFMNPLSLAYSLTYSPLCYLTYILSILVLVLNEKYVNWKLFFIFGCLVCFLDLLNFPIVVLCFPLLLIINIYNKDLISDIRRIVGYSVSWVCGYLGLWFNKFLLATIFTSNNVLKEGVDNIKGRIGNLEWSFYDSLELNFAEYKKEINWIILFVFLLMFVLMYFLKKHQIKKSYVIITNFLIGLYPFVWCLIVRNHSIVHPWIVYRIFTISIMAMGFIFSCCVKDYKCFGKENVKNKEKFK